MNDTDSGNIKKRILKTIIAAGYQIAPDALDFLVSQSMGEQLVEEMLSRPHSLNIPIVITLDFLLSLEEMNIPLSKEEPVRTFEEANIRRSKRIQELEEREQLKRAERDGESTPEEEKQVQQIKSHASATKTELVVTTNLGREIKIHVNSTDKEFILDRPLFDLNVNTQRMNDHELDSDEFREYIPEVDLTSVSVCRNLRIFELSGLGVHEIDLSPLAECRELEIFSFKGPSQFYYWSNRWGDGDWSMPLSGALIDKIDLSPLKKCENLRVVVLSNLNLSSLDLIPLNECTNLEKLNIINPFPGKISGDASRRKWMAENSDEAQIDFEQIRDCLKLRVLKLVKCPPMNLNPLRRFTNLRELEISDGVLDEIDLGIFSDCAHLKKINLTYHGDNLKEIDLGPVSKLPNIEELDLTESYLSRIDLGPLMYMPSSDQPYISWPNYQDGGMVGETSIVTLLSREVYGSSRKEKWDFFDVPVDITSLHTIEGYYHSLKKTNEPSWKQIHLLQCIPNSIGMPHLGLLDANPDEFLLKIFKQTYEPDDNVKIQELYIKYLCDQIDRGGTTIGIDLDKDTPAEIMMRSTKILELREKEMQSVSISISEEGLVDYLPLWITAYGSRVLTSLGRRLSDNITELPEVEKALQELGYSLDTTGAQSDNPTKMSLSMMQYIKVICDISKLWDSSLPRWEALQKEWVLNLPYFTR